MKCLALLLLGSVSLACSNCAAPANTNSAGPRPSATTANVTSANASANKPMVSSSEANSYKAANSSGNTSRRYPTGLPKPAIPPPTEVSQKKDEGLFSFPPPKVTSYALLKYEDLLNPAGPTTFDFVGQKVAAALETAGYTPEKYAYFWNDRDEFAIVTAMERIEADGNPLPEPERWNGSTNLPRAHRFDEYFRYLFGGKIVYYRVFAFVVTSKRYGRSFLRNSPPDFGMALNWMNKGEPQLGEGDGSTAIETASFNERYRCYALLYLFVNHTSLDSPRSVDSLTGPEMGLEEGLNKQTESHLANTHVNIGGTRHEP